MTEERARLVVWAYGGERWIYSSFAHAADFGRTRKRLLATASTRYAIRSTGKGRSRYGTFWGKENNRKNPFLAMNVSRFFLPSFAGLDDYQRCLMNSMIIGRTYK